MHRQQVGGAAQLGGGRRHGGKPMVVLVEGPTAASGSAGAPRARLELPASARRLLVSASAGSSTTRPPWRRSIHATGRPAGLPWRGPSRRRPAPRASSRGARQTRTAAGAATACRDEARPRGAALAAGAAFSAGRGERRSHSRCTNRYQRHGLIGANAGSSELQKSSDRSPPPASPGEGDQQVSAAAEVGVESFAQLARRRTPATGNPGPGRRGEPLCHSQAPIPGPLGTPLLPRRR